MNARAYEAMGKFVKIALHNLKKTIEVQPPGEKTQDQGAFVTDRYIFQAKQVIDYAGLICRNRKDIINMPEAREAGQVLLEEGIIEKPFIFDGWGDPLRDTTFDLIWYQLSFQLMGFIISYYERNGSFNFIPERFEQLYREYEQFWMNHKIAQDRSCQP
jgi:hypothetical protein